MTYLITFLSCLLIAFPIEAKVFTISKPVQSGEPLILNFILGKKQNIYWTADLQELAPENYKNKLFLLPADDTDCEIYIMPALSDNLKKGFNDGVYELDAGSYKIDTRCPHMSSGTYQIILGAGDLEFSPHPLKIGPIDMNDEPSAFLTLINTGKTPIWAHLLNVDVPQNDPIHYSITAEGIPSANNVIVPPERSVKVFFKPPLTFDLEKEYFSLIRVTGRNIMGNNLEAVVPVVAKAKFPSELLALILFLALTFPALWLIIKRILRNTD